jgi:hypothetical protein
MVDGNRNNGPRTERDENGRFQRGNSGRPKGARHKATLAALALLDGEAEALTRKAIERALGGDVTALRLTLERIVSPCKDTPVTFLLPSMTSAADASRAMAAVLEATSRGDLTPGEAAAVAALVEQYRKTLELTELEARIVALEANHAKVR